MAKEMKAAAYAAMPPTEQMVAAGFGFPDLIGYATNAVDFLEKHAAGSIEILRDSVELLRTGFRMWGWISQRDFMSIMLELNKATVDVQALIQAIKDEFGIE